MTIIDAHQQLHRHQAHRAQLVEKAREAYAAKKLAEKSGASSRKSHSITSTAGDSRKLEMSGTRQLV